MIVLTNLNQYLVDIDNTTLKFNGSLLWMPAENRYLCAFRAIKKPFNRLNINAPDYPYMWLPGPFWYNDNNYIGIVMLNPDYTPIQETFRKYYHLFNNIEIVQIKSKDIEFSGPEDPRLYFKKDGQPYMLYNTLVFEDDAPKCTKQCVGMYEVRIKPKYFNKDNPKYIYTTIKDRKILCASIINKLAKEKKGLAAIKNFAPISGIPGEIEYIVDSYNDYKIFYAKEDRGNKVVCTQSSNGLPENCDSISIPQFLRDMFSEQMRQEKFSVALTTPEIVVGDDELFGVAHIRIKHNVVLSNKNKLNPRYRQVVEAIEQRNKENFVYLCDFYYMVFYTQDRCGKILKYSKPFYPMIGSDNTFSNDVDKTVLYNVVFPCGVTKVDDDIVVTYGDGDCLLNTIRINKDDIWEYMGNYTDMGLEDLSVILCNGELSYSQTYSNLTKDIKKFRNDIENYLQILLPKS